MEAALSISCASSLGTPLSTRASITLSAMTSPLCASMFSRILFASMTRFDSTLSVLSRISSSRIIECERVNLSADELARSLSCHSSAFSYDGIIMDLTILANPHAFSAVMGLRLWAIVEDPTCLSASKASATSEISLLCRFLTSWRTFSTLVATFAIHPTHSM